MRGLLSLRGRPSPPLQGRSPSQPPPPPLRGQSNLDPDAARAVGSLQAGELLEEKSTSSPITKETGWLLGEHRLSS